MEKLKVGLDFDGVILDIAELAVRVSQVLFGKSFPLSVFRYDLLVPSYLTSEEYTTLRDALAINRRFALNARQIPRAKEFIDRLKSEGWCEPIVVSHRSGEAETVAREWMFFQGIKLPFVGVDWHESKSEAAKDLDAFVDDDARKLITTIGAVSHRFLFSQAYNEDQNLAGIDGRVKYWSELYWILRKIHEDKTK